MSSTPYFQENTITFHDFRFFASQITAINHLCQTAIRLCRQAKGTYQLHTQLSGRALRVWLYGLNQFGGVIAGCA